MADPERDARRDGTSGSAAAGRAPGDVRETDPQPDPQALARLHAACFTMPRPWSAAEFAALLADPPIFTLGDAEAVLLGRAVAGEAELLTLAVSPQLRRQGRARALLDAFDAAARARNATDAFLEVAADNTAAIALYTAAGWRRRGLRRGYFRAPDGRAVDAEILGKPLA